MEFVPAAPPTRGVAGKARWQIRAPTLLRVIRYGATCREGPDARGGLRHPTLQSVLLGLIRTGLMAFDLIALVRTTGFLTGNPFRGGAFCRV